MERDHQTIDNPGFILSPLLMSFPECARTVHSTAEAATTKRNHPMTGCVPCILQYPLVLLEGHLLLPVKGILFKLQDPFKSSILKALAI